MDNLAFDKVPGAFDLHAALSKDMDMLRPQMLMIDKEGRSLGLTPEDEVPLALWFEGQPHVALPDLEPGTPFDLRQTWVAEVIAASLLIVVTLNAHLIRFWNVELVLHD